MADGISYDLANINPEVSAGSIGGFQDAPKVANESLVNGMEGLTNGLQKGADVANQMVAEQQRKAEQQKNMNATSLINNFNFTPTFLGMKNQSQPGAPNFTNDVSQSYDNALGATVNNIADSDVRDKVRNALQAQKKMYINQATEFQINSQAQNEKNIADAGLNTIQNNLLSMPTPGNLQLSLDASSKAIDALPTVNAQTKERMKIQNVQNMHSTFISGLFNSGIANTPQGLQQISDTMNRPEIKANLAPDAYSAFAHKINALQNTQAQQSTVALDGNIAQLQNQVKNNVDISSQLHAYSSNPNLLLSTANTVKLNELNAQNNVNNDMRGLSISGSIQYYKQQLGIQNSPTIANASANMISNIPANIVNSVSKVSKISGVDQNLIASLANAKYSFGLNNMNYGKMDPNTGVSNSDSNSEDGFLKTVKDNADIFSSQIGQDVSKMKDEDLLKYKNNVDISLMAKGLYARSLQATLGQSLGRQPTNQETFSAMAVGADNASNLIKAYENNPNSYADQYVNPEAVQSNKALFTNPNGSRKTVAEMHADLLHDFAVNPAHIASLRVSQAEDNINKKISDYNKDPAQYMLNNGVGNAVNVDDPDTFSNRASDISSFSNMQGNVDMQGEPLATANPLTKQEAISIGTQLSNPELPTDNKLKILSAIQNLHDPILINRAYQQIGEKDQASMFAGFVYHTGDMQTANDILEGRKFAQANPEIADQINIGAKQYLNATTNKSSGWFSSAPNIGQALVGFGNTITGTGFTQGVLNAATNAYMNDYYVKKGMPLNTQNHQFDSNAFAQEVNRVLGGDSTHQAIQSFNGHSTYFPKGINANQFSTLVNNISPSDLVKQNKYNTKPYFANYDPNGTPNEQVSNYDFSRSTFQAVGGGFYRVQGPDGRTIVSLSKNKNGGYNPYLFKLDKNIIAQYNKQ